jgi:Cu2+-exporting ATPase
MNKRLLLYVGLFVIFIIIGLFFPGIISGIFILVFGCMCVLEISKALSYKAGQEVAAKNGIIYKDITAMENLVKTQVIALDKSKALSKGEPVVTDIFPSDYFSESGYSIDGPSDEVLLNAALLLEQGSEHPYAKAVRKYAEEVLIETDEELESIKTFPGNCLEGELDGNTYRCGNLDFILQFASVSGEIRERARELANSGKTPVFYAKGKKLLGIIAVADTIKEDSSKAVSELKAAGLHVVMLTDDNEDTAKALGKEACVDEVIAEVLPEEKGRAVKKLSEQGKVAMVGDGIKDEEALSISDIGIAIGAGSNEAIAAADVIIVKNSLLDVAGAVKLSRATNKNIRLSLYVTIFFAVLCILFWLVILSQGLGALIYPLSGVAAMCLSGICIIINSNRLKKKNLNDIS